MSCVKFTTKPLAMVLKGKTMVITGGASGIGEAYVRLARQQGANVVFGDVNDDLGKKVAAETGATFVRTDVTEYKQQLNLFQTAWRQHGRIDHAISNAGVYEPKGWFSGTLDLESVQEEPSSMVYDINIRGSTIFAHIASVYLSQGKSSDDDQSLTLISSTAGIHNAPKTPLYSTSKAGIIGLSRCLSRSLPKSHGIRVNAICPSITDTPLAAAMGVTPVFEAAGIPIQSADDVAGVMLSVNGDPHINGNVLYVMSGKTYDIEEGLRSSEAKWLGQDVVDMNKKLANAIAKP